MLIEKYNIIGIDKAKQDLDYNPIALATINQVLNSVINQGYKLVEINSPLAASSALAQGITINTTLRVSEGTIWYFAIP